MRFITFFILILLQTNSKIGMYGLIYIYTDSFTLNAPLKKQMYEMSTLK